MGDGGWAYYRLAHAFIGILGILIITIIGCLIGSYVCGKTSDLMNTHDDPHIVFDEWVGMWIALLPIVFLMDYKALDAFTPMNILLYIIMPFILFRFLILLSPFRLNGWIKTSLVDLAY